MRSALFFPAQRQLKKAPVFRAVPFCFGKNGFSPDAHAPGLDQAEIIFL